MLHFNSDNFQQIPREKKAEADFLALLALSDDHNISLELCMDRREQPSIKGEQVPMVQQQDEWMTPIIHFLKEGQLPEKKTEA